MRFPGGRPRNSQPSRRMRTILRWPILTKLMRSHSRRMRKLTDMACGRSGWGLVFVLLVACGGSHLVQEGVTADGREIRFPTQSRVIGSREPMMGFNFGFYAQFSSGGLLGILIEKDGCLRLSLGLPETHVIVWPAEYQLSINGDLIQVRDRAGALIATVGDTIGVSGIDTGSLIKLARFMSGPESIKLARACGGPYWLASEQIYSALAMSYLASTGGSAKLLAVGHRPDGEEVIFPTQAMVHVYYSGEAPAPGGLYGAQLIEQGGCLRGGSGIDSYLIIWPPGYQLTLEGDRLLILNELGEAWARVGDTVVLGGHAVDTVEELVTAIPEPYGSMVAGTCPGPYWILSDPVNVAGSN